MLFFRPAALVLNRLKYPQKFGLISLLFALPLIYVMQQFLREVDAGILLAAKERTGTAYLRPLRRLLEPLSLPNPARTSSSDASTLPPSAMEQERQVGISLRELDAQEQAHGVELETIRAYQTLYADWRASAQNKTESNLTRSRALHDKLRTEITALMSHVGDTSTLILDPDLDSYYTMNAVVVDLPACADLIIQARALGAESASNSPLSSAQQAKFLVLAGQLQQSAEAVAHDHAVSFTNNPSNILKPTLQNFYVEVAATHTALARLLTNYGSSRTFTGHNALALVEACRQAQDANLHLWNPAADTLDSLLAQRAAAYTQRKIRAELFAMGMLLLVAYLYSAFYLTVMRMVSSLEAASERMSRGDMQFSALLVMESRDELAQVARSFNTVASRLYREWKQAQEEKERAAQAEERYRAIVENALEGIFQTSVDGHYLSANPALARIYGYGSPEEMICALTAIETQLYVSNTRRGEFARLLEANSVIANFESEVRRRDGSHIWITENARIVCNPAGEVLYYEGSVIDITERKRAEEQLHHHALHDALTDLPNRLLFQDRLRGALSRAQRSNKAVAVLFVDLDNFKMINDSMGHEAGDALLKQIAARLQAAARREDTIARMGGDEFTLILEGLHRVEEAAQIAENIVAQLQQPVALGEREVFASASIGIVYSENPTALPEDLLRDADTAMYHAKTGGKAGYILFDSSMNVHATERLEIETGLRFALDRNELRVHYQPLVDLETGRMSGVEALARWEHPTLGMIAPGKFIAIAEDTGLIIPIGYWVLEEACRQTQAWKSAHPEYGAFTVNVNLSGKQLLRADVVERVGDILTRTGLKSADLKLEITESVMMADVKDAVAKLTQLKALGVKLAMDDFGTGYSSIASLNLFPLDTVKIDRSFVARLADQEEAQSVIAAIVMLSRALNLNITGEGIETKEQLAHLQGLGCQIGQGYYFAKPLPPEALEARMAEEPTSSLESQASWASRCLNHLRQAA